MKLVLAAVAAVVVVWGVGGFDLMGSTQAHPLTPEGSLEVCNPDGLCWPGELVACMRWYVDGDPSKGLEPGYIEWHKGRSRDGLSHLTPERARELGLWRPECDEPADEGQL